MSDSLCTWTEDQVFYEIQFATFGSGEKQLSYKGYDPHEAVQRITMLQTRPDVEYIFQDIHTSRMMIRTAQEGTL